MTNTQDVAAILRAVRAKLDLSQEQLAERLGVSFATVNRWEGGMNTPQKAARAVIAALAEEAGVEMGSAADEPAAGVTRRRRGGAVAPTTKPMEQMLWDAACSIRGEKDAPKFKDYLLPLLFLKRLSDVFDDEVERLAEDYGDRTTALEIAESDHSLMRFYLPPEARWSVISGREAYAWPDERHKPKDIGEHLTKAVRAVVKQNPALSGVIDVVDFAAERNGERDINPAKLRAVVETFSDPRYRLGLADVQPDFLGRAYEYLLRKFAEGSGQSAGEFFTPTEVGFLMAHIMRPRPGEECHDYACGSAGLLVKLQLVARELDPTSKVPLKLTAQELQAENYAIAQMNGVIHDMDIEIARGDTMINPKFRTADGKVRKHDIIVANPMWNQPFNPDIFANDPFDRFRTAGGITTGKGDWAWLQHTLACLNDHGRAAVVLDTGAVTRGSNSKNEDKERNIRKWFVDRDLIDGVILLPNDLFYNTPAAGVIVVLNKRKPTLRRDRIVLLNASRHVKKGKPKNYIPEGAIRPLATAYLKGEPVEGEIAVITREQAEAADYNLSPSKWVGVPQATDIGSIASLVKELERLNNEDIALTASVLDMLRPIAKESVVDGRRGLRGEAQKATAIGLMAESWEVSTLSEVASIERGRFLHRPRNEPRFYGGATPFVQTGDVVRSAGRIKEFTQTLNEDGVAISRVFPAGTILITIAANIGYTGVLQFDGACPDSLVAITPNKSIDTLFLEYFLRTQQSEMDRLAPKGTQKNINIQFLNPWPVPLPTLDEQREIVAVLDAIDRKIELHKRKGAVLEDLFKAMLHKLITGEIRVSDLYQFALAGDSAA